MIRDSGLLFWSHPVYILIFAAVATAQKNIEKSKQAQQT